MISYNKFQKRLLKNIIEDSKDIQASNVQSKDVSRIGQNSIADAPSFTPNVPFSGSILGSAEKQNDNVRAKDIRRKWASVNESSDYDEKQWKRNQWSQKLGDKLPPKESGKSDSAPAKYVPKNKDKKVLVSKPLPKAKQIGKMKFDLATRSFKYHKNEAVDFIPPIKGFPGPPKEQKSELQLKKERDAQQKLDHDILKAGRATAMAKFRTEDISQESGKNMKTLSAFRAEDFSLKPKNQKDANKREFSNLPGAIAKIGKEKSKIHKQAYANFLKNKGAKVEESEPESKPETKVKVKKTGWRDFNSKERMPWPKDYLKGQSRGKSSISGFYRNEESDETDEGFSDYFNKSKRTHKAAVAILKSKKRISQDHSKKQD